MTTRALYAVWFLILAGDVAVAAPWTEAGKDGVVVDWSAGTVSARGIGPADRHAPSPAVARVAARRAAEEQARAKLTKAARALKLAGGGTVGAAVDVDEVAEARLAAEIGRAPVVESDLVTDGSARVTIALGVEAVRQAVAGPRAASADDGAAVTWIVDAASLRSKATPAVGWSVSVGGTSWTGPIVWRREAGAGADAIAAKATGATGGVMTVSGPTAAPPPGALVVVVVPEK